MATHRELLEPVIRDMLQAGPYSHVTNQDIANEGTRRTGIRFTATEVSSVRISMRMGYRQMVERGQARRYIRQLEDAIDQIREDFDL